MQLEIVFLLYSEQMSIQRDNLKLNNKILKLKKELWRISSLQVSLLDHTLILRQMDESMMVSSVYEQDLRLSKKFFQHDRSRRKI